MLSVFLGEMDQAIYLRRRILIIDMKMNGLQNHYL